MDKKITKEWNKIKDYNIFHDIDEFALLFIEKPYGICMRKYTSYPWCKENFFFGSYDELKEWYLTTDEIPFYVKEVVGQKFAKLTVLDFLYKNNSRGIRTLHAKCKCDCGNTVEVDYRSLKHGDILGCGCRINKKSTSVFDYFKELVEERWDYSKNIEDPQDIEFNSDKKYWWKGYKESYLMAPKELLGKPSGTSFPEQAIFFYLSKLLPNVENRVKIQHGETKLEADIFLNDYNIAIEYDGVAWHKSKLQKDIDKSNYFASQNIYVIRARESGLEDFDIQNGTIIEVDIDNLPYLEAIAQTINKIIVIIKEKIGSAELAPINDLSNVIRKDRIAIESGYLQSYEKDNIANTWLIDFWDEENGIEPYKVSIKSTDKFYFRCNAHNSILISPNAIMKIFDKVESEESEEQMQSSLLIEDECPFASLTCCPCNALYHTEELKAPCRAFINYDNNTPLFKELGHEYEIEAQIGLRTTPFHEYAVKYLTFIETIKDYSNSTRITLIDYFTNLLFYKIPAVQDMVAEFIMLPIDSSIKQKYLETIFCYPNFGLKDVSRVFANENLLEFYFTHFDYRMMFANEGNVILNLSHAYPIFDTLKSFIYDKKLTTLNGAVKVMKRLLHNDEIDIILSSLALQLSATYNYRYKELKRNAKSYNNLISILKNNASTGYQPQIIALMDVDCLAIRLEFYQKFIEQKLDRDTLKRAEVSEIYKMLSSAYGPFIQVINGVLDTFKDEPHKRDEIKSMIGYENYFTTTSDGKIFWLAPKKDLSPDYIFKITYGYENFSAEQKKETLDFIDNYLKTCNATVDISNIDEPEKYIAWFNEYGTSRFKFNLNVIVKDENYSRQFFNLIIKIYDGEEGYRRKYVHIAYIYEQCKKMYQLGSMPDTFAERLKKLILYIQNYRSDLGAYEISDGYDINDVLGVPRADKSKCIIRIHDIDEPIRFNK